MSQRFQVDGVPVAACEGVFSRAFDMTADDAEEVVYDATYVVVAVCTTLPPGFRTDKNGDLIRRNRFEVSAAKVAKGELGNELAEMFELDIQQKLPFTAPPGPASLPGVAPVSPVAALPSSQVTSTMAATATATIPRGTPVGKIDPSEDDELRRFLDEGGSS